MWFYLGNDASIVIGDELNKKECHNNGLEWEPMRKLLCAFVAGSLKYAKHIEDWVLV